MKKASCGERPTYVVCFKALVAVSMKQMELEPIETTASVLLGEAAALVGVASRTLRLPVERGQIAARHPLAEGPWIFSRAELDGPASRRIALQAASKHPAATDPDQQTCHFR